MIQNNFFVEKLYQMITHILPLSMLEAASDAYLCLVLTFTLKSPNVKIMFLWGTYCISEFLA